MRDERRHAEHIVRREEVDERTDMQASGRLVDVRVQSERASPDEHRADMHTRKNAR
jgi:hypothetical protein